MNQETKPFSDHFSAVSAAYADYRPNYPSNLFDWLAETTPSRALAWDCACGSGQASFDLAERFDAVAATDASENQLAAARSHPKVTYRHAPAEASGLADASVDLITVATALHWFDLPRFYTEARRVLKPDGVLAAWCYGRLTVAGDEVNTRVRRFYNDPVGPYWPPERKLVDAGYRTLDFPFAELAPPAFELAVDWPMARLMGYLSSWSATARYIAAHDADPVQALAEELAPFWGDPETTRRIRWPLHIRAGQAL